MDAENAKISTQVRKCYAEIAKSVNPSQFVIPTMVAEEVTPCKEWEYIDRLETNSEKIFELIGQLFEVHPNAFIVFRKALEREHSSLVKKIDGIKINSSADITEEAEIRNKLLKEAVIKCSVDISNFIEPKGYILDLLYQECAIQWEDMSKLLKLPGKAERVKRLLQILDASSHKSAYIIFVESIAKEPAYRWIAKNIESKIPVQAAAVAVAQAGPSKKKKGGKKKKDIFISYRRGEKKDLVKTLYQILQNQYSCWFDESDIGIGTQISPEIKKGIDECKIFMAFFTEDYFESEWCLGEVNYALDGKKDIVQIRLEEIERNKHLVDIRLNRMKYHTCTVKEPKDWKESDDLRQISDAIRTFLNKRNQQEATTSFPK